MDVAMLAYCTDNIGDEIQSLATMHAVGREPDVWVDRDFGTPDREVVLLCNAWMTNRPKPFPSNITPIYHGISLCQQQTDAWFQHFRDHAPIGCRDENTLKLMRDRGIESYMAYCSTLTLPRFDGERHGVHIVDVPDSTCKLLPDSVRFSHITPSVRYSNDSTHEVWGDWRLRDRKTRVRRFMYAKQKLASYGLAELVVTSRLHCALPCIALGTPVVFINDDPNDIRFSGYQKLLTIHNKSSIRSINWDNVQPVDRDLVDEIAEQHMSVYRERLNRCLDKVNEEEA